MKKGITGPGLTQPSILKWSVNEYQLRLGRFKGRYVRRCLVRAMYLSASEVGLSYLGRYTKCSTFTFTFYILRGGSKSKPFYCCDSFVYCQPAFAFFLHIRTSGNLQLEDI